MNLMNASKALNLKSLRQNKSFCVVFSCISIVQCSACVETVFIKVHSNPYLYFIGLIESVEFTKLSFGWYH